MIFVFSNLCKMKGHKSLEITTSRMESFSDGVIAILITIMVFDIKVPNLSEVHTGREVWKALESIGPKYLAFLFSFMTLGIMWLNHHHMYYMVQKVDERMLWLNLNLLFWLSTIPFPTAMIGSNPLLPESAALFGAVLTLSSISFLMMRSYAVKKSLMDSKEKKVNQLLYMMNQRVRTKNLIGILCYLISIPLAYVNVYSAFSFILVPSMIFFVPDRVTEEDYEEEISKTKNSIEESTSIDGAPSS